jgi:hypothetical protein
MKRRVVSSHVDQVNDGHIESRSPTAIYAVCNRFSAPDLEMMNSDIVQASPVNRASLSD